jgi:ER degradation enhancer, mannosidase alpha-like 2
MKRAVLVALAAALVAAPALRPTTPTAPPVDRAALTAAVRDELRNCWRGYERYAWGHDELKPVSRTAHDWHREPLLMTPVDALDTLLLVGLDEEANRAKALILARLSFDRDVSVKNFEITIRLLGGLLSAHQATGDPRLLALAEDLGRRLLPAFSSPTGMPYMYVNLKTGKTSGARSNPAEIGTLLLEWGTLSKLTGKPFFYEAAKKAVVALYERRSPLGLVGEEIDVETGKWLSPASHVGGGIDSYYEYLLKSARLFDDADCARMWTESLRALNAHLADEAPSGLWYGQVDMNTGRRTADEFGALHAFLPGVLALGGDLDHARRLQDSCLAMWRLQGIEPELLDYRRMRVASPAYPLRPEIVESAFYLHRLTKDPRYLEMGRTFFEDIRAHCRTEAGDTVLKSVVTKEKGDLMPSYFLAETLKYFYLLFSGEPIDFEKVVFNTEAHPLRKTWGGP